MNNLQAKVKLWLGFLYHNKASFTYSAKNALVKVTVLLSNCCSKQVTLICHSLICALLITLQDCSDYVSCIVKEWNKNEINKRCQNYENSLLTLVRFTSIQTHSIYSYLTQCVICTVYLDSFHIGGVFFVCPSVSCVSSLCFSSLVAIISIKCPPLFIKAVLPFLIILIFSDCYIIPKRWVPYLHIFVICPFDSPSMVSPLLLASSVPHMI